MKCSCTVWLAFTTVIYFSCTIFTVHGKCSGRWAIHACYGGNGKRSGTDMTVDNAETQRQLLLRQLLIGNAPMVEDVAIPEPVPADTIDETEEPLYDTTSDQISSKASDLNRVKSLLISLLLEKKFREAEDDFSY